MMSDPEIWQQYISALEKQNRAKDQERATIYFNLNQLQSINLSLTHQLDESYHLISSKQQQINELSHKMQELFNQCESMHQELLEKEKVIFSFMTEKENYFHTNKADKDLEQVRKELLKKEKEIEILKQQNKGLQTQILQVNTRKHNQAELGILIQNYQTIEKLARELESENLSLTHSNQILQDKISRLENQIKTTESEEASSISYIKDVPNKMELIHQNNELIEKLIQLERQRNQFFFILRDNDLLSDSGRALKQIYPENSREERKGSLANHITKLKQENEVLLQKLRI